METGGDAMEVDDGVSGHLPSGWRSRQLQLQELIKLCIEWNEKKIEFIYKLIEEYLSKVPENSSGKKANVACGIPSLTGSLFPTWYKTLFEGLLQIWTLFSKHLASQAKRKDQQTLSEAELRSLLINMDWQIKCFLGLVQLTKTQKQSQRVKNTAVKLGGKFVKEFSNMLPFWHPLYKNYAQSLAALIGKAQKGTKILQVLCSEGKVQKDSSLTQKVPETKKYLESFVYRVKEMLADNDHEAAFWMGNLKHKNLDGQVVPSQAFTQQVEEDDGEGEDQDEMIVIEQQLVTQE
eukprot:TRINITY_DN2781_c1_g2_i1.p1 TRINITY_DN2781_c1_g2~~TRINITY_DN2781_c1_g2_i1.p1  ORF type:complete len:292 (-),score=46.10 TRINITY_DN2781_c1_g2_i1:395-1270(-)